MYDDKIEEWTRQQKEVTKEADSIAQRLLQLESVYNSIEENTPHNIEEKRGMKIILMKLRLELFKCGREFLTLQLRKDLRHIRMSKHINLRDTNKTEAPRKYKVVKRKSESR